MKNIKSLYENADVHIVMLDNSDIITTSGGSNDDWGNRPGSMDGGGWDIN